MRSQNWVSLIHSVLSRRSLLLLFRSIRRRRSRSLASPRICLMGSTAKRLLSIVLKKKIKFRSWLLLNTINRNLVTRPRFENQLRLPLIFDRFVLPLQSINIDAKFVRFRLIVSVDAIANDRSQPSSRLAKAEIRPSSERKTELCTTLNLICV